MPKNNKDATFRLSVTEDHDTAYLKLPINPSKLEVGVVKKSIRLVDLGIELNGTDVILDFDEQQELIGIEVLILSLIHI